MWALGSGCWGSVVPGVEDDSPLTRVGFDSQWGLPMSCSFRMCCCPSLSILNQATQDVLSARVGFLYPPLPCLEASSFVISTDYCNLS